jgi:outer membrane receptor protein involved in Fe transport
MQRRLTLRLAVAGFLVLLLLDAKAGFAQAVTGTLLGTVQDSSGAVVPNANVTLTNEGTNVTDKTVTGPQGFFTFPNLNPGEYSVGVEAQGFKKILSAHNVVAVEQTTRVDLTLTTGAVNEQVTVNASAAPLVETTTSDLGESIDQTQVQNLPVNGRIPMLVMQLAPGTSPAAWGSGNPEDSSGAASLEPGGGGGGDYTSSNGFPFESNLYLVDGVNDVEQQNAYAGLQIPFAMIQEFKLETSNPTAEYGTFGGMVSNITTKSGTNAFHGQAFEYNRQTAYDATDFFSHLNPPYHSNQFGAEVDGPIIKDKLFFAADFQWLKTSGGASGLKSVPTAAARSGNLSGFDVNGAGPITNANACEISAAANSLPNPVPCTASASDTVAGTYDTVPAADIVPIAGATKGFLQSSIWPLPSVGIAGTQNGQLNNAAFVQDTDFDFPQEDARVDYAFSQSDRFFARFSYGNRTVNEPLHLGADTSPAIFMNNGNNNATNQTTNDVIGWDHTFGRSGTMMNELRLGYSRFATSQFTTDQGIAENNALSVPNGNISTTGYGDTNGIAQVNLSNWSIGTGDPGTVANELSRLTNIYEFNDAFTLVKGRHTWKFGFILEPIQSRVTNPQDDPRGQFSASGSFTGNGSAGAALADWLVGALNGVDRDHFFDKPNTRTKDIGEFAQDDFRLTNKVTLNLGIRYDIYTKPVDTNNFQSNFVTTGTDAGLIQVASASNRGPNTNTFYGNLAPRLGVAYTPDNGKTAFRAAFGMSYFNDNFGADGGTLERNFPELEIENNNSPLSNCSTPYGPGNHNPNPAEYSNCGSLILANGLPGNVTTGSPVYSPIVPFNVPPGGAIASPPGFGVFQVASNFRQDTAANWNVSIERQLDAKTSFHAAYVGTAGNHLYHDYQLNQCNPTAFGSSSLAPPAFPQCSPIYDVVGTGISTLDFRNSGGKSHYNSGQFEVQRRAGQNLTFTAAYTWSKMMDNINNPLDGYWQKEELDTVSWQHNNFPRTLTATYVYTLPFGRNQMFANSISPLEDAIIGGWSISGVTWYRSGPPMLMGAQAGPNLDPQNNGQRANYACAEPVNPHTLAAWFDTSCFSQPTGFAFGNAGVGAGNIVGPRYISWDMSFAKAVHLAERMQVQFQAQFFNTFNTVNLQQPNNTYGSGSFGVINGDFLPRIGQLGLVFSF